jgi:hypothetical protein
MVFVALGLLIGNRALGVVDVEAANRVVRILAEATLTLVMFTDARAQRRRVCPVAHHLPDHRAGGGGR